MFKEFKEFALKGNVLDLAIGVIIGAAFGKIVSSFVDDILMPPLGLLLGNRDFSNAFVALDGRHFATLAEAKAAAAPTLNYGLFFSNIIDFILVAFAIFLVIKQINRFKRKPAEEETPSMRDCPECLSPIPIPARRCKFCSSAVA